MILLGCDHAGFPLKEALRADLEVRGVECLDLGVFDETSVDYPDLAHDLARRVAGARGQTGILVCGTGIGMSMAANRHRGVRAALCHDLFTAEMARRHNDANVLCLGARVTPVDTALEIAAVFLTTPFEGGRHQRRVAKIEPPAGSDA